MARFFSFQNLEHYMLARVPELSWDKYSVYEVERGHWWFVDDLLEGRAGEGAGGDE